MGRGANGEQLGWVGGYATTAQDSKLEADWKSISKLQVANGAKAKGKLESCIQVAGEESGFDKK